MYSLTSSYGVFVVPELGGGVGKDCEDGLSGF